MGDKGINHLPDFWVEDKPNDLLAVSGKKKRKAKTNNMEFVGWGSKPLINFLESICKDTSKKISLIEAETIIKDYINANNLTDPHKKKRILCDERLHSLFRKKSLPRIKIHQFLEKHFPGNQSESDDDFMYSSEENDVKDKKRQKASLSSNGKDVHLKKRIKETSMSCFAAIIPANFKLLYLKRRLVEDLYKDEETFETKLVGSFVRVKSDPNDYLQKNSHQLLQVTGVKKPYGTGTSCTDILLEVSNVMDDVRICMLSDDNFSEEECEDLRERIKSGSLKRPTTVEFQEKAELLHADITKHWLERELHLLQNLIDRANEKGWRKELFEYLERRQLLESPEEQKKLILEVPKVIAEELELEAKPVEEINDPPKPILRMSSVVSADISMEAQILSTQNTDNIKAPENLVEDQHIEAQKAEHIPEIVDIEDEKGEAAFKAHPQQQIMFGANKQSFSFNPQQQRANGFLQTPQKVPFSINPHQQQRFDGFLQTQVVSFSIDPHQQQKFDGLLQTPQLVTFGVDQKQQKNAENKSIPMAQIVELSDDDEEEDKNVKQENLRTTTWHYVDPQGTVQGPFDLENLKRWSDAKYFPADFKVFQKTGHTSPVLLSQLLASVKFN